MAGMALKQMGLIAPFFMQHGKLLEDAPPTQFSVHRSGNFNGYITRMLRICDIYGAQKRTRTSTTLIAST
jgi:hypothetical protein